MDCRVAINEEEILMLGERIDPEGGHNDDQMRRELCDKDLLQLDCLRGELVELGWPLVEPEGKTTGERLECLDKVTLECDEE
jgi:hypothetical protein